MNFSKMRGMKRKIQPLQFRSFGVLAEKFYLNSYVRYKKPANEHWDVGYVYFEPKEQRQKERIFRTEWFFRQPSYLLGSDIELQGHSGKVCLRNLDSDELEDEETLGNVQFKESSFVPGNEVQFTIENIVYNGVVDSLSRGDVAHVTFFDTLGDIHSVRIGFENLTIRDDSKKWIRRFFMVISTCSVFMV